MKITSENALALCVYFGFGAIALPAGILLLLLSPFIAGTVGTIMLAGYLLYTTCKFCWRRLCKIRKK